MLSWPFYSQLSKSYPTSGISVDSFTIHNYIDFKPTAPKSQQFVNVIRQITEGFSRNQEYISQRA